MLMFLILLVACFAANSGIEVIARVNGVVTTITIVTYTTSFFMFIGLIDMSQLKPFLTNGISHIAYGGLLPLGWLSESAIILLPVPLLKNNAKAGQ
ncbi:Spore germination protein [compost metagenome]